MTSRGAVVIVSPYEVEYGPPRTLEHVVTAVLAAGYQPICVVPPDAMLNARLGDLHASIHVVRGLSTVPRTLNPWRLAGFMRDHLAAAREIADVAGSHAATMIYSISEATFCGALAARRLGVPSLVHVIGMSIQSPRWAARTYIPVLNRLTDRFVACSSAVAEMLAAHGVADSHIRVVHNGSSSVEIDASLESPSPPLSDAPRIGMVAAYDARKGHELFIEAAALILRRQPGAHFYLIGGHLEGQPESLAFEKRVVALIRSHGLEEHFTRPGFVAPPAVYAWIRAMDVLVVPSQTEAFAHVLLEGMLCNRAVVATAIEGNLDAFVDRHSGRYAAPTPESLAAIVGELIEDPAQRAAIGAAARERAKLLFDTDVTLPALAETIVELMQG
jgi:glycosyltransferase involved in cell wall biosynthesis